MKCKLSCMMAMAFTMGSLYITLRDKSIHYKFYKILDKKQRKIYLNIKYDRMKIASKASMLGIALSLVYKFFIKRDFNPFTSSCIYSLIYSVTQYLVYSLHPKKDWMIKHLKGEKQVNAWLKNYKIMKFRWHYGLLMGIVGYGMFCYFIESNMKPMQK